jgi:alpha/beta hydrolase family protein
MNQRNVTWRSASVLAGVAVVVLAPILAQARVTRIELTRVESPAFGGASFGAVGQYEKLAGRAFGEIDPADPRSAVITDIRLAARNAKGMVEYSTDLYILRPLDRSKGNHRLFFEINNRGGNLSFGALNDSRGGGNDPSTAADAGNGYLMRQGYTLVWCGWDATVEPGGGRFTIAVPVAKNPDGSAIMGPELEEFVVDNGTTTTGTLTYPAATLEKSQANLTVRVRYQDPPVVVPAAEWEYADDHTIRLLPAGARFRQGTLYEFTYQARDPVVAGLGFAAIRDVAGFLHHAAKDDNGNPNPLAGDLQYVYSFCVSQPCRTLHDFLWLGFNDDGAGRVFDGMLNWVGGGSGIFMNYRFAQPGRTHRQHIARWYPEYQFPFANQVTKDAVTGKTDGRLRRCLASHTCPDILEVNSENEYWAKAMSVFQLDASGHDLPDPPDVRYYLLSSLPHGAGANGPGICQQPRNPLNPNTILRALLVAMDDWVSTGKKPPESRMPRRSDGTLVPSLPQDAEGFPNIPGVKYNGRMHTGDWFDFGPHFDQGILSIVPPVLRGTPYPALVPKTDSDGNDIAGIRLPDVTVPLATYTGWALRANAGDDGCDAAGQKIDFAQTKAERLAAGDERPSIEERYPNHADYVSAVTRAANDLRGQRLLLDEDVRRYIEQAEASSVRK